jgi:hypothetical protein
VIDPSDDTHHLPPGVRQLAPCLMVYQDFHAEPDALN